MTRSASMAYPPFDGTAALEAPLARPSLTLLEGGASARPASGRRSAEGELTRRQTLVICLLGLAIVGLLCVASLVSDALSDAAAASAMASVPTETVVVQEGGTLWGIAQGRCPEGVSTEELVRWISENNGLTTAALTPGQVLSVPAPSLA